MALAVQQAHGQVTAVIDGLRPIRQFAVVEVAQHLRRLRRRHAEDDAAAGPAAIQPQHEPRAFRRAAVAMAPQAEAPMKAPQQRGMA